MHNMSLWMGWYFEVHVRLVDFVSPRVGRGEGGKKGGNWGWGVRSVQWRTNSVLF